MDIISYIVGDLNDGFKVVKIPVDQQQFEKLNNHVDLVPSLSSCGVAFVLVLMLSLTLGKSSLCTITECIDLEPCDWLIKCLCL